VRELLTFLVHHLVEDRDAVDIREAAGDRSRVFEVRVSIDDRGRLIGKHGRTIKSVRALVAAAALREGKRVVVEVVE
jgi:hypothetical protein